MSEDDAPERDAIQGYLTKLNAHAWGVSLGVLFALILFSMTTILLLRGGDDVGTHLGLLSQYLPGYDVTPVGAFLGLGYGFVLGYLVGWIVCTVYNMTARD